MPSVGHALKNTSIVVDAVVVLAIYEEGSLHASTVEEVQSLRGILEWTIIESNSNGARNSAVTDYLTDGNLSLFNERRCTDESAKQEGGNAALEACHIIYLVSSIAIVGVDMELQSETSAYG
jgi:hypothetical protein